MDSIQGDWIGNCWLIAAAIGIAEQPDRLKKAFLIEEKNSANVYAVRLYALGAPLTITIDDYLPLVSERETIYGAVSSDGALWGPVLEKAYAKYIGNYEALNGGYVGPGIENIVGSPWQDVWHDWDTTADELWEGIKEVRRRGGMVTAGSPWNAEGDAAQNEQGIAYSHAYALLGTVELSTGDRLVAVANPWGEERYHGPWSDSSPLWTDALRREADHVHRDDGKFFMPIEGWLSNMEYTTYNYDVERQHHAYFMVLGDTYESPDRSEMCGSYYAPCTKHTFTVFSRTEQTVRLSAHTWQDGFYLGDCLDDAPIGHTMYIPQTGDALTWGHGSQHTYRAIRLQARQKLKVELYMNFGSDVGLGKDFALTAWSDVEPVRVIHMGGLISDHWDDFDLDESIEIPTDFSPSDADLSTPEYARCHSTNDGAADVDGDACDVYASEPSYCGGYDDSDFVSNKMCCACGGGEFRDPADSESQAGTDEPGILDEQDGGLTEDSLLEELESWAALQEINTGVFCDYQIKTEYPFGEEYMVLWANQNCVNTELYLTLVM